MKTVVALGLCLSGVVLYSKWMAEGPTNEMNDYTPVAGLNAEGFAGYHFVSTPKSWDDARDYCRENGMVLATADSAAKIDQIMVASGGLGVHVGYRAPVGQQGNANNFVWESGAPTSWAAWKTGEPNDLPQWPNEFCTYLEPSKEMNNVACNAIFPFACDKSPYLDSYAMHGVNGAGYNYDQAAEQCRIRYGSTLATIGNADRMVQLMTEWQWPSAWIGLRLTPGKDWAESNFEFVSEIPRQWSLNWGLNQPDNSDGSEHCTKIVQNQGSLEDVNCKVKLSNFICDLYVENQELTDVVFEQLSEMKPSKNNLMPNVFFDESGKQNSYFTMMIKINYSAANWRNVIHVGNQNTDRNPSIFQYPGTSARLHFAHGVAGANAGCDPPAAAYTFGQWIRVEVFALSSGYEVKINGVSECTKSLTIPRSSSPQSVWLSNNWYDSAWVTVSDIRLRAY